MTKEQKSIYIKGARGAQPQKHRGRNSAQPTGRHYGTFGFRQSTLAFDTIFAEGSAATWRASRPMPDNSWARSTSPMWMSLRVSLRPSPSNRRSIPAIRVRRSAPRPNCTTTLNSLRPHRTHLRPYGTGGDQGRPSSRYTAGRRGAIYPLLPEGSRVAVAAPLQLREGQGVIES